MFSLCLIVSSGGEADHRSERSDHEIVRRGLTEQPFQALGRARYRHSKAREFTTRACDRFGSLAPARMAAPLNSNLRSRSSHGVHPRRRLALDNFFKLFNRTFSQRLVREAS